MLYGLEGGLSCYQHIKKSLKNENTGERPSPGFSLRGGRARTGAAGSSSYCDLPLLTSPTARGWHIKKSLIEEPKASCCSLHLLQSSTLVKAYSSEKIGRDGRIAILELKVNLKPSALVWMNFYGAFCLMLFL
jgi:hypothetical protein